MPPPPNRRWIILIPLLSAVALAVVMIGLRARSGDLALRIRIVRALNEGGGEALSMTNMAAFTWDELVILGPRSGDAQLSAAQLPFYARWLVGLSSRDDICLLAFKVDHKYRGHVVMPRNSGDFGPAVSDTAYTTTTAVFVGTKQGTTILVKPAVVAQGPRD